MTAVGNIGRPTGPGQLMNASATDTIRIIVNAERTVAVSSPDHLIPWGTSRNNSRNPRFNEKLCRLYPATRALKILDLGCAGGGFVKDCIDAGHLAVGLEGSDYSQRHRRAEWATIPEFLFTCDITGAFEVLLQEPVATTRVQFDVVTSWEVLEHITEADLDRLIANVKQHLAPGGLWIMSIASYDDICNGVNLHQTVKPQAWWVEQFRRRGLEHHAEYVRYFNTQYVRGPKFGAPGSFHLVLCAPGAPVPAIPRERITTRLLDRWIGSRPQRILRLLVVGNW